jgi:HEAT repeat protein
MIRTSFLLIAMTASLCAQSADVPLASGFQAQTDTREDADYRRGRRALDNSQWDQAITAFNAAASRKSGITDGALYWKAYAQSHAGRREEALSTIADLRRQFAGSRWLNDAQALELEIKSQSGSPVNPASESNDDLKLMALNSLMQSDPKQALPILDRLLQGGSSPRVKERALFVLAQNPLPESRKMLGDMARGSANPELQRLAIRYIGMMGNDQARNELASLYESTTNKAVKSAVLQSFMLSGSRNFLLRAATSEKDPDLQRQAVRQLAMSGGDQELWKLYQSGSATELKQEILKNLFMSGKSDHLLDVVRTERDPQLRVAAIKSLGMMGNNGASDLLVSTFRSDRNRDVREAVLNALFLQQNGKALVDLARNESDPEMKREIVKKLSLVQGKESKDYMLELLK